MAELNSAQLIRELLRNEVSVGTEVSRKQCDGDSVNKKNTKCEQIEKLHIKKKWSDVVVGKSINR